MRVDPGAPRVHTRRMDRRYVVLGAGGVGCALGGSLQAAGAEVVLIARGAQLEALAQRGLVLSTPSRRLSLGMRVVARPRQVSFTARDVVLLCVKTQHAMEAVSDLMQAAPADVPIVCAQNGVVTERIASTFFTRVMGMVVFSPIRFTEPGVVSIHAAPIPGGLEIGNHPRGADGLVRAIVADFRSAGFDARAEPRIERWKYGKLLTNLGNAAQALAGDVRPDSPIFTALLAEATAALTAGGIEFAPAEEVYARYSNIQSADVGGAARGGGSSWQSLARMTGNIETGYLNGAIVGLGERHGVATPCNRRITELARRAAEERWPPGRMTEAELERALGLGGELG